MEHIRTCLIEQGVSPHPAWLHECIECLAQAHPRFHHMPLAKQVELCFSQFLDSDMNVSSAGTLTQTIQQLHKAILQGRHIFQIDEVVDIGAAAKERYVEKTASASRCLKLSLTEGSQRVFAIEYRPTAALQVFAAAGTKIAVTDANVRRGFLLLVPENVDILGGSVELLEAARKRAVARWNQPPSGRRTMHGVPGPSLVEAAVAAAWAADDDDTQPMRAQNQRRAATVGSSAATHRAPPPSQERHAHYHQWAQAGAAIEQGPPRQALCPRAQGFVQPTAGQSRHQGQESNGSALGPTALGVAPAAASQQPCDDTWQPHAHSTPSVEVREGWGMDARSLLPRPSSHTTASSSQPLPHNTTPATRTTHATNAGSRQRGSRRRGEHIEVSNEAGEDEDGMTAGTGAATGGGGGGGGAAGDDDDDSFTYLAHFQNQLRRPSLVQWPLRGRIKCMVMGIQRFEFKGVQAFYLSVHIEDGSSISEATVMHQIVSAIVGCSPHEVVEKLSSDNAAVVAGIKGALRELQALFAKFEGLVDLELRGPQETPQIVGMSEGVTLPETYSLFKRLELRPRSGRAFCSQRDRVAETINLSSP